MLAQVIAIESVVMQCCSKTARAPGQASNKLKPGGHCDVFLFFFPKSNLNHAGSRSTGGVVPVIRSSDHSVNVSGFHPSRDASRTSHAL
jgi:hypothetical protein